MDEFAPSPNEMRALRGRQLYPYADFGQLFEASVVSIPSNGVPWWEDCFDNLRDMAREASDATDTAGTVR